jgi:hypothetical protein
MVTVYDKNSWSRGYFSCYHANRNNYINPQSGKVVVRNTPEQLDLIATLIERLNASAAPPAANN